MIPKTYKHMVRMSQDTVTLRFNLEVVGQLGRTTTEVQQAERAKFGYLTLVRTLAENSHQERLHLVLTKYMDDEHGGEDVPDQLYCWINDRPYKLVYEHWFH